MRNFFWLRSALAAYFFIGVITPSIHAHSAANTMPRANLGAMVSSVEVSDEPYLVQEFSVTGTPNISVRPGQGSITLIGASEGSVRVEIYVTRRGLAILQSDRLMDDYRVVVMQRNNQITAEVASKRGNSWSSSAPSFNFVVYAPSNTNASLVTGNGNIEISNISGTVEARNGQGNLSTSGGEGSSRLFSAVGSILVNAHSGVVFANAMAGDVSFREVDGETRLKLVAGNAVLENMQGTVIAHVTTGNIRYNSLSLGDLVDLETIVGNIQANFTGNRGLELNIQGTRVSVGTIRNFTGDIRATRIAGQLNGGGIPIRMKTTIGEIDVDIQQDR